MNPLYKLFGLISFVLLFFYSFLFFPAQLNAYYSCGGSPCNLSYPCNAGLICNASQVCGAYVNTCSGLTCQTDATWSQGVPYNCVDGCTPGGTTNSATFGACSASCGPGTETCNCVLNNNCPTTCTGGVACGGTRSCCTNFAPQNAPNNLSVTQLACSSPPSARVNWNFTAGPDGCAVGAAWGYDCTAPQTDTFTIEVQTSGGTPVNTYTGVLPTATQYNINTDNWGAYRVMVCADNSSPLRTCSSWFNFTLTAPTCVIDSESYPPATAPAPANCYPDLPTLTATRDSCSNQTQFYVYESGVQECLSSWLVPEPASYTSASCSPATGSYAWGVRAGSSTSPVTCSSPAIDTTPSNIVNIDKTDPAVPVAITPTWTPNPSCLGEYMLTYNWNASTDTGCAGLHTNPYQAQIATNPGFTTGLHTSAWQSTRSYTTTPDYYVFGTSLYAHVKARDSVLNESAYSATNTYVIPSPTLYPTIHIEGEYEEDLNGTDECVGGMTIDPNDLTIELSFDPPNPAISYTCTPYATWYECNISVDNQSDPCLDPGLAFNISNTTYGGYEEIEYRTGNDCAEGPTAIPIDPQSTPIPDPTRIQTFFDYGEQTWFKASDTSFDNLAQRNNIIPNNIVAFDADDTEDRYLIVKEAGSVLSGTGETINVGANAETSANDWYSNSYSVSTIFTPSKFRDYVKSRKQYKTIETVSEITASGIYYLANDITLTSDDTTVFNGKNILLLADDSNVTIDEAATPTHEFIPTGSLAIIADGITITGTITEINAILVGNSIEVGTSLVDPLKVTGNLIQLSSSPKFTNTRTLSTRVTPSLFIKFDKTAYLNLLPYLSISMYDWRQIQ